MQVGKGIRATLTCAWCGREVPDAKAQQDVASGRILLAPAPTTFLLTSGRPTCIVCGGPLLLEDWRTETPEYGPLHMEATGGPDEGSAAA